MNFTSEFLSNISLVIFFHNFYGMDNESSLVPIFIACSQT